MSNKQTAHDREVMMCPTTILLLVFRQYKLKLLCPGKVEEKVSEQES